MRRRHLRRGCDNWAPWRRPRQGVGRRPRPDPCECRRTAAIHDRTAWPSPCYWRLADRCRASDSPGDPGQPGPSFPSRQTGVSEYLALLHPRGSGPSFRELPRWPPGLGHLAVDGRRRSSPGRCSPRQGPQPRGRGRGRLPIALVGRRARRLRATAGARVVQGLSGGLDSRAIATAAEQGLRPLAYTYGTRGNRETVWRRQWRPRGWPTSLIPVPDSSRIIPR